MTRKLHTVGAELEKISLTTDKSVIVLINLGEVTTRRKIELLFDPFFSPWNEELNRYETLLSRIVKRQTYILYIVPTNEF